MRGVPDFSPARLRACRAAAGLSQEALGVRLGADRFTVSHWESGRRKPEASTLEEIARALGATIDDLLEPPDPDTPRSLAAMRRSAGLSQQALADQLGIKRATYSAIERGAIRQHRAERIAQLSQLLKVEESAVLAALRQPPADLPPASDR
jgi:transcriptional regulator with XRE-family HTH domain